MIDYRRYHWYCRLRIVCCIHRARIIGITNDGCISNVYYIKTNGMRTNSSRRTISLHPGQNGRCTDVIENSRSQNAQIFGYVYQKTNGPNHGLVWNIRSLFLNENLYGHSFGRTIMGKAIRESSLKTRTGKSSKLVECFFR